MLVTSVASCGLLLPLGNSTLVGKVLSNGPFEAFLGFRSSDSEDKCRESHAFGSRNVSRAGGGRAFSRVNRNEENGMQKVTTRKSYEKPALKKSLVLLQSVTAQSASNNTVT